MLIFSGFGIAQDSKEDQILKKLNELQKSLEEIKPSFQTEIDGVKKDLEENKKDIMALKADVESLKSIKSTTTKKPEIVPYINPNPANTTQKGKLRIYNLCDQPYNLIINDQYYHINAWQSAVLDVPAGTFTYKVCGIHSESLIKSILPNDEYRILIHPNQTVSQITNIPIGTYLPNCQ